LAAAPGRIDGLGTPIALEKGAEAEAVVVVTRNADIGGRLARDEAALGLTRSSHYLGRSAMLFESL
jgi:hypothetical protein